MNTVSSSATGGRAASRSRAAPVASRISVLSLSVPQKSKQTAMIGGSPAEAAKELVRRLREEARAL